MIDVVVSVITHIKELLCSPAIIGEETETNTDIACFAAQVSD